MLYEVITVNLFQRNLISADRKKTVLTLILEDIEVKDEVIPAIEKIIALKQNGVITSYSIHYTKLYDHS